MISVYRGLRGLGVFLLACFLSLAAFGLILALLQALAWNDTSALQLAFALASAALAFLLGGLLSAWLNPEAWPGQALAYGLLFGSFSFVYLLGFTWGALVAIFLAILLAAAGGRLARRLGSGA